MNESEQEVVEGTIWERSLILTYEVGHSRIPS